MKCIEENSERLDLLQKTFKVEEKQNRRLLEIALQKRKEMEEAQRNQIGGGFSTTTMSMFDQEEAIRKSLVLQKMRVTSPKQCVVWKMTF